MNDIGLFEINNCITICVRVWYVCYLHVSPSR
jgi:hypothetical protein